MELVYKEDVMKMLNRSWHSGIFPSSADVNALVSVDIEKASGQWVKYCCSNCGASKYDFFKVISGTGKPSGAWNYCPKCGSKMGKK